MNVISPPHPTPPHPLNPMKDIETCKTLVRFSTRRLKHGITSPGYQLSDWAVDSYIPPLGKLRTGDDSSLQRFRHFQGFPRHTNHSKPHALTKLVSTCFNSRACSFIKHHRGSLWYIVVDVGASLHIIAVSHQAASIALATLADESRQGEGVELTGVGALLIDLKRTGKG